VYFGDLHVHTSLSFDSYLFGNRNGLDDAYRFANGLDLSIKTGEPVRLSRPLDFVAITDHAESFAIPTVCQSESPTEAQREFCEEFENPSIFFFQELRRSGIKRPPQRNQRLCPDDAACLPAENTTWAMIKETADKYYRPGEFTTFLAYEYSPVLPESGKVHRNVIFRNSQAPDHAVSAYDAETVLDLWRSLERDCREPCEALTIPHNMNKMWGIAYSGLTIDGAPYSGDDWALRGRSEPIAEIFQVKGASECGLGAGAVDEECNFEQPIPACEDNETLACTSSNSFAREGLKKGLRLAAELGFNPLRFGFVAATDTHNGNPGDTEEWDFRGASGLFNSPAKRRLAAPKGSFKSSIERNPGGLAVIWAEENTREALFDAMKRRETYATSGTRIKLRFFAGENLPKDLDKRADAVATAYNVGTPMGSTLPETTTHMRLYVSALRDPFSAPLQRLQIIKGWLEDGKAMETVTDIACGDGFEPVSGRCPDNGARVDLSNCAYSEETGAAEISLVWEDKKFDPGQTAFYYARVLENPTCRWSTWDALRTGMQPRDDVPAIIQERAWSSAIWF
ncbi:MAG: DUF3604 domain-containing protein, partial [Gammaproteobacteria bacterium]|nr:DUF3604 domain-containing protein [Gammaproteobacteria bacterium]